MQAELERSPVVLFRHVAPYEGRRQCPTQNHAHGEHYWCSAGMWFRCMGADGKSAR